MLRWLKLTGINTAVLLLLLLLAEVATRQLGHTPGNISPYWSNFAFVDTLIEYHHFYVNDKGLQVAYPEAAQGVPINKDGFRTPGFEILDTTRHRLLLIGDSYTWGLSAQPLDSCFADRLQTMLPAWQIINTGIPSTDPVQYHAIAGRYIPRLKPVAVIVALYLGNDLMQAPRPLRPHTPLYFYTNAGALLATDEGRQFTTAQLAYRYYRYEKYTLRPRNLPEKIIACSALLSRLYAFKYRWHEKQQYTRTALTNPTTARYLLDIKEICWQHGAAYHILVIPRQQEASLSPDRLKEEFPAVLAQPGLQNHLLFIPQNHPGCYTPSPDLHFNNQGHAYAAQTIYRSIALSLQ